MSFPTVYYITQVIPPCYTAGYAMCVCVSFGACVYRSLGTCFDEHTDLAFYSIPGYTLISDAYRISSHCGVAIYLNNDFSHERQF